MVALGVVAFGAGLALASLPHLFLGLFVALLAVSRIATASGVLLGARHFGYKEDGIAVSRRARMALATSLVAGWIVAVAAMLVLSN